MHTDFSRDERRLTIVAALFVSGLAAAVVLGKPGHAVFLPPCIFHAVTGWFCPGCGTTRAMWYVMHGHPLRAMGENFLSIALLPFVCFDIVGTLTRRWKTISSRLRPWALWTLLIVVILFALLRNLPFAPFTYLAPTNLL